MRSHPTWETVTLVECQLRELDGYRKWKNKHVLLPVLPSAWIITDISDHRALLRIIGELESGRSDKVCGN